jgi:hypothetical protein
MVSRTKINSDSLFSKAARKGVALRRGINRKVRQIGLIQTVWFGIRKVASLLRRERSSPDFFDSKYGTDTARTVGVWALDIPDGKLEHTNRYETVAPEVFYASLSELEISYEGFVFIDMGSGKGRALLLASRFDFREIIGVELSAHLNAVANSNLGIFTDESRKCFKIQSICQDVLDYQLPNENLVVYLYNPFGEQVMRSVVSKLEDFVRRFSKSVYVLYQHPLHKEIWEQSECFRAFKTKDRCAIFRTNNCV